MWDYALELRRSNSGTTFDIDTEMGPNQTPIFKRIHIFLMLARKNGGCHAEGFYVWTVVTQRVSISAGFYLH